MIYTRQRIDGRLVYWTATDYGRVEHDARTVMQAVLAGRATLMIVEG